MNTEVQQDKKVISNDRKVLHMSIGISLVFFGISNYYIFICRIKYNTEFCCTHLSLQ